MYVNVTSHSSRRTVIRVFSSVAVWTLLAVLFLVTQSSLSESQPARDSAPIRIGAVLPLSGDSAAWGQQGRWGIDFAVRKVNSAGGINGQRVEVAFEDSQAVPRL